MKSTVVIRQFKIDEWELYKTLRLNSLIDSPYAFGGTFDTESGRANEKWKHRLHTGINSAVDLPLLALCENQPAGLAWGKSEQGHIDVSTLYQMWVDPTFRGNGIGLALLENIRLWAQNIGSHSLLLGVTLNNGNAYQIYEAFGFEQIGNPEPLREGSSLEIQPMKLDLVNKYNS